MGYRGYGTPEKIFISGHVLDDRVLYEADRAHKKRKNVKAMISRYMAQELADVNVRINFEGKEKVVATDKHGYFEATFEFESPLQNRGWVPIKYQAMDKLEEEQVVLEQEGEVYVLEDGVEYGVISDVDDTILVSHATNTLKKLRLMLTKNAKTRLPFPGVAPFYHALHKGTEGKSSNPLFFVSSSEYNLYDFLVDFCEARGIPKGVFLLQEYKSSVYKFLKTGGGSHLHKKDKIRHLLKIYPDLNFILIGDSGQKDPEIYMSIADQYPDRILAIYIRDIKNKKEEEKYIDASGKREIPLFFIDNTKDAAEHAFNNGLIEEIEYEKVTKELEAGFSNR